MLSNMILDPIFIFTLKMGFAGAGWATLAGQVIGAFTLFSYPADTAIFLSGSVLPGSARHVYTTFWRVALPIFPTGHHRCRQRTSQYGSCRLRGRHDSCTHGQLQNCRHGFHDYGRLGTGLPAHLRHELWSKELRQSKKARKLTISVGTVFLLCVAVLLAVFAVPASALLSKDEEVIRLSAEILRIQCISVPFLGYYTVSSMYMQNIGHYGSALLISIARQGFFYIPLLFLLPALAGQMGLFLVQPVADILSFAFSIIVVHFTPSQTPVSSAPFSSQKASR